ncbi:Hypothetical protein NTJ_09350 [Nesidiocoris tenuis]|uniref:Uncharacterized protein n=1 Tax=Nesidiocoris tenuis TaxID=355587 RepID=A0ABN7AYX5_9HEMI|nr:Hypothetical protein NTJ_09350 [Nesidiocoris tenuis]
MLAVEANFHQSAEPIVKLLDCKRNTTPLSPLPIKADEPCGSLVRLSMVTPIAVIPCKPDVAIGPENAHVRDYVE